MLLFDPRSISASLISLRQNKAKLVFIVLKFPKLIIYIFMEVSLQQQKICHIFLISLILCQNDSGLVLFRDARCFQRLFIKPREQRRGLTRHLFLDDRSQKDCSGERVDCAQAFFDSSVAAQKVDQAIMHVSRKNFIGKSPEEKCEFFFFFFFLQIELMIETGIIGNLALLKKQLFEIQYCSFVICI